MGLCDSGCVSVCGCGSSGAMTQKDCVCVCVCVCDSSMGRVLFLSGQMTSALPDGPFISFTSPAQTREEGSFCPPGRLCGMEGFTCPALTASFSQHRDSAPVHQQKPRASRISDPNALISSALHSCCCSVGKTCPTLCNPKEVYIDDSMSELD